MCWTWATKYVRDMSRSCSCLLSCYVTQWPHGVTLIYSIVSKSCCIIRETSSPWFWWEARPPADLTSVYKALEASKTELLWVCGFKQSTKLKTVSLNGDKPPVCYCQGASTMKLRGLRAFKITTMEIVDKRDYIRETAAKRRYNGILSGDRWKNRGAEGRSKDRTKDGHQKKRQMKGYDLWFQSNNFI